MSLFHAAWSPCLWVFGYSRVQEVSRSRKQPGSLRQTTGMLGQGMHLQTLQSMNAPFSPCNAALQSSEPEALHIVSCCMAGTLYG